MKKQKFLFLIIITLFTITLTSCSLLDEVTNNEIVNRVVRYDDVSITEFNQMIKVAVDKASGSNIAVISEKNGILTANVSLGSGVIIKRIDNENNYLYYALTNRHVVDYKGTICERVKVIYDGNSNNSIDGTTITYDQNVDIALIQFSTTMLFEPATINLNRIASKGDIVIAYGTPYSLEYFGTSTFGIISNNLLSLTDTKYNTNLEIKNTYIQHDAAINGGNSGGGLFDIYGNLIGINTKKLIGTSSDPIEGIGFAIPIVTIMQLNNINKYFN